MQELFILLAKLMTPEMVVEHIKSDLAEYELVPTEDNKKKLAATCMLFALQCGTEGKDLQDVLGEFSRRKTAGDMWEKHAQ